MIARQGEIWPIDKKFMNINDSAFDDTWEIIADHFDLRGNENADNYVFVKLDAAWRDWKSRLKSKYYNSYGTDQERMENVDSRVNPDQWKNLIAEWGTEKAKAISEQNKANRRKKVLHHHTGSMSFARKGQLMCAEGEKSPTRLEVITIAYQPKPSQSNVELTTVINEMNKHVKETQQSEDSSRDIEEIESEAITKFLGPEKTNRLRGVGVGVKVQLSKSASRRMRMAAKSQKNSNMLEEDVKETMTNFMKKMAAHIGMEISLEDFSNFFENDQVGPSTSGSSPSSA